MKNKSHMFHVTFWNKCKGDELISIDLVNWIRYSLNYFLKINKFLPYAEMMVYCYVLYESV